MTRNNVITRYSITLILTFIVMSVWSQSAFDHISHNRYFSASNYCVYPDSTVTAQTPPPAGKRPFYISHYGRHGSRYLSNRKGYDIPYKMLCKADSMDELTPIGQDVLRELRTILYDAEGQWGDLTGIGKQQQRNIAKRMVTNFPEVFKDSAFVDAYTTIVNRCILSMGSFVLQMASMNPQLRINMNCTFRNMWYMNHQDELLRDSMMTHKASVAFKDFSKLRSRNPRLMELLFVDSDYVQRAINEDLLNYYLLMTALIQQNTHMGKNKNFLLDLFTYEDIHQFWQRENAWWYICYGPSFLNGGNQPYSQRYLLRHIINETDSILQHDVHGATLRFGHETVVLPLVCLLGINGYDYQTLGLETLESKGWWACLIFPMASNLQFVFYRDGPDDKDVIFKVLLNEREAMLPLKSDIAPYYHWNDFRRHYLQKLDKYESTFGTKGNGIHPHLPNHSHQPVRTRW